MYGRRAAPITIMVMSLLLKSLLSFTNLFQHLISVYFFEIKFFNTPPAASDVEFFNVHNRQSSRDAAYRRVSEQIAMTTESSCEEFFSTLGADRHDDINSHPKLTHLSSLSAPDINEVKLWL